MGRPGCVRFKFTVCEMYSWFMFALKRCSQIWLSGFLSGCPRQLPAFGVRTPSSKGTGLFLLRHHMLPCGLRNQSTTLLVGILEWVLHRVGLSLQVFLQALKCFSKDRVEQEKRGAAASSSRTCLAHRYDDAKAPFDAPENCAG